MIKLLQQIKDISKGNDTYIVGGWIRDRLLNRSNRDLDLACEKDPASTAKKVAKKLNGSFVILDKTNKIYRVVLKNNSILDYIDFAGLKGADIFKDLEKRDFTINSMALQLTDKINIDLSKIIDPLGGKNDLKKKIIRLSYPKTFIDDPIRLLRAFRLSIELNFTIDKSTLTLIKKNSKHISESAPERIREELFRILSGESTKDLFIELEKLKILECIFPEISSMKKSAQKFYYHPHGLWQHSIETLGAAEYIFTNLRKIFPERFSSIEDHLNSALSSGITRKSLLKFVSLFHDVAKPDCAKRFGSRMRFLGHEDKGSEKITRMLENLKLSRKEIRIAASLVKHHMRPTGLGQAKFYTKRAVIRILKDMGEELPELLLLSLSDCYSYKRLKKIMTVDLKKQDRTARDLMSWYFNEKEKPVVPKLIDGHILIRTLKLKPGPIIGKLLEKIAEAHSLGKIKTKSEAVALARKRLTLMKK